MSRRSHTRSTDVAWTGVLAGLSAAAAVVVSAALCARSKARVAEMARTKAAQLEAERARHAKDDLLASVSHELRTPLNAIVGWAYMLRLPTLSDVDRQHAIEAIDRNAKAETRLVAELLDEASSSRGRLRLSTRPCDVSAIIRSAVRSLQPAIEARDLRLQLVFGHGGVRVEADEARLEQAIWSLLSNAVRFTPPGGAIRVETACAGPDVRVRVRDTGEGIERDFLPYVFDAFRQGPSPIKRPGLGLGLSLVKHLVELHGGTVSVASAGRGAGATFTITVPIARRRVSAAG